MNENNFLLPEELTGIYTDYYELLMAQGYYLNGMSSKKGIFDYFFRKTPFGGGYVIFAGLNDFLDALEKFRFPDEAIRYLKELGFRKEFLEYLKSFRFTGNLFSVREGEIVFPNEPIVRVEASLTEAQLIETLLLNILNFQSLIATKASRIKLAAEGRTVIDFGMRRAQGYAAIFASRAAIIGGFDSTSNVAAAKIYDLTATGTMAHSWVQSFSDELSAFRKFTEIYPDNAILLVDTFNTLKSGIPNAIKIAGELEEKGKKLFGIRLDSGDLAFLSKKAREMLDEAGLEYVKIAVSNQLDEYLIKSLIEQKAEIDAFGVGTNLVIGKPDAALDGVYKMAQLDEKPKMKISENPEKMTLPGVKNILRFFNGDRKFFGDAIILEKENPPDVFFHPLFPERKKIVKGLESQKLLKIVVKNGESISRKQSVKEIADYSAERLRLLDESHKRFQYPHLYKVGVSQELLNLRNDLKAELEKFKEA